MKTGRASEIEDHVQPVSEKHCASAPLSATFIPGIPCTIRLPAPVALWSPETPNLYNFTATFGKDVIRGYFGMRKIEKRRDAKGVWRFFLNNRPFYIMATLDQGWWPDGLLTPQGAEVQPRRAQGCA